MNYQKPDVLILGSALEAIQNTSFPKGGSQYDSSTGQNTAVTAAYDIDE